MECLSPVFAEIVSRILDGPVPVLATIAAKGSGFIAEVVGRQDVELVTVTAESRDRLPDELVHRFQPQ
jgi:nucleoside-triphosphatase